MKQNTECHEIAADTMRELTESELDNVSGGGPLKVWERLLGQYGFPLPTNGKGGWMSDILNCD
jgi:bacteriocin-like protein